MSNTPLLISAFVIRLFLKYGNTQTCTIIVFIVKLGNIIRCMKQEKALNFL